MKNIKNIILFLLCSTFFISCDEIEFLNLKRDNPLDIDIQEGIVIGFNSFVVSKDDNNDKVVNRGETIELKVSLKNTGGKDAKAVKATFSTTSPHVNGFTPTSQVDYGDLPVYFTEKWADYQGNKGMYENHAKYYTVKFKVSDTAPVNRTIPIDIKIIDGSGNTWSSSFEVEIEETI